MFIDRHDCVYMLDEIYLDYRLHYTDREYGMYVIHYAYIDNTIVYYIDKIIKLQTLFTVVWVWLRIGSRRDSNSSFVYSITENSNCNQFLKWSTCGRYLEVPDC